MISDHGYSAQIMSITNVVDHKYLRHFQKTLKENMARVVNKSTIVVLISLLIFSKMYPTGNSILKNETRYIIWSLSVVSVNGGKI